MGASFKRCSIRDGCRQSAPFDSIVTWSTTGGTNPALGRMLEEVSMPLIEKSSERKLQVSAPGENRLLATIAICFVILHIFAATILTSARQSDAGAAPEPPGLSSGD